MTIQQFFQVAAGAIVSLVIYSTNMAGYVKWPLIVTSFLIGVALAFFPIEDRPLTKWIVLFAKAIYSPTVYVWNKSAVRHSFFQPETDPAFTPNLQQVATPNTQAGENQLPQTPPVTTQQDLAIPEETKTKDELDKLEEKEKEFLAMVNQEFTAPTEKSVIKTAPVNTNSSTVLNTNMQQNVSVPKIQDVKVDPSTKVPTQPQPPSGDIFKSTSNVGSQVSPIASHDLGSAQAATYTPQAAPPSPPTRPNIVVGQILDEKGGIIDGVILEIKDADGRSVRALRTNRLGHFMIVTPLTDGKYQIVSEKDNYQFAPISIDLNGRVVPPISITGKLLVN